MEQVNLHKQKLYSLIIAGVAFISLLLPWLDFFLIQRNGLRDWGLLSLLGVGGVVAACLIGNKALPFDDQFKKIALASFGAIGLGALIFFIRLSSKGGSEATGIGVWLCLIIGVLGVLWVMGIVKLPSAKKP
jgi:hypothetical protein